MNGQPTVTHSTNSNEQLVGKFHVEKLPNNAIGGHDETGNMSGQLPASAPASVAADESACASRFQMIRVDRNFQKGRWKVNDYEPPENTSASVNLPVIPIENEPVNSSNPNTFSTMPTASSSTTASMTTLPPNAFTMLPGDANATSSTTLAASAAAIAAAIAFQQQQQQQQQQQRLSLNNPGTVLPGANVQNPAGLLHAYPGAALTNMPGPNQSYILANHPQFGYYPFYPPPYGHYPPQWAALGPGNPYLAPPPIPQPQAASQPPPGTLGDPLRHMDGVPEGSSENPVISSNPFQNSGPSDHLQNAHLAAAQYLYAAHHSHPNYLPQAPPGTASPYATIPAYHTAPPPASIIPPTQLLSVAQAISNNQMDPQQQHTHFQSYPFPAQQQPAPILTSPKHDASSAVKTPVQQQQSASTPLPKTTVTTTQTNLSRPPITATNGTYTDTLRSSNPNHIADLLSSSPSNINSQQTQASLLSPITVQTTNPNNNNNNGLNKATTASFNEMWPYTTSDSPLNLAHTAAQTAVANAAAAMALLNNESGKDTEIAHEILKGLNTPTKQNNTTDIDNKISQAMDLVKVHLLTAVRDEVTELRQQIRILTEKVNTVEHENAFLRQHVPSEIYAQYTPPFVGSTTANDSTNPSAAAGIPSLPPSLSVPSSQSIPMASLTSLPSSIAAPLPQAPIPSSSSSTISTQLTSAPSSSMNHPVV